MNSPLDVYQYLLTSFPDTLLIIAPRHVKRASQIEKLVADHGIQCRFRTHLDPEINPRTAPVVIFDTIGELQALYSIASIVFCGGSLVPLGGHNILEPAVWGKPVLFGPSMEDFMDAKKLLEQYGGGIQINNSKDMAEAILDLLSHPEKADNIGSAAKAAVMAHTGAAKKHAAVICKVLEKSR